MHPLLTLLAAAEDAKPQPSGPAGLDPILMFLPVVLLLFYLMIIRPMRRQEQERQALAGNLKKNDRVLTTAGIYGVVVAVSETEDEVTVRVDDNVRLKMTKASVLRNLTNEEAAKAAQDKAKEAKSSAVTTKA